MRTTISYDVVGANKAELERNALGLYRELVGDAGAEFPRAATIDITPGETTRADGTEYVTVWQGSVTVTEQQQDGAARA